MALISKWFKVATASKTVDGREIKESWLTEIAESYDRSEYTASIFRDHFPWYGNFGIVNAVKTERDNKNRLCLYAKIEPNPRLLELNKDGQSLFTSISILPDFAGTKKCYLGHLAITDTPASLGTDKLAFNAAKGLPEDFIATPPLETDFDIDESAFNKKQSSFIQRLFNMGSDESNNNDSTTQSNKEEDTMNKETQDKLFSQLDVLAAAVTALQKQFKADDGTNEQEAPDAPADFSNRLEKIEAALEKLAGNADEKKPEEVDFAAQIKVFSESLSALQADFKKALGEQDGTNTGAHAGGGEEKIELY